MTKFPITQPPLSPEGRPELVPDANSIPTPGPPEVKTVRPAKNQPNPSPKAKVNLTKKVSHHLLKVVRQRQEDQPIEATDAIETNKEEDVEEDVDPVAIVDPIAPPPIPPKNQKP